MESSITTPGESPPEGMPDIQAVNTLATRFNDEHYAEAEHLARTMTANFPAFGFGWKALGVILKKTGRCSDALPPMQHAATLLPADADTHYNLGTTLHELTRLDEAIISYRKALQIEPNLAEAHSNMGAIQQHRGQLEEALASYRRALAINPDYAQAHSNLGTVLQHLGQLNDSAASYCRALEIDPNYIEAHYGLGNTLHDLEQFDSATVSYRRALMIRPEYPEAHYNLGNALRRLGQLDNATLSYRRALEINPDYADAGMNLGQTLLATGRLSEGWKAYEARYAKKITDRRMSPPPIPSGCTTHPAQWQGEPLPGKSMLVWPEQGFGDEIQFARYLPLLKARGLKHLTMACKPPLKTLFTAQNLADRVISTTDWHPEMAAEFDYWCYPLSLPLHFGSTLDNLPATTPYLAAPPDKITHWAPRLPKGEFRVGLVWQGSAAHPNDALRSIHTLATLATLWSIPGITFISLQKDAGEDEASAPPINQPLTHLGNLINDFADSAALLSQLDLLICVDTAVAHLAGAMEKPCWLLLPSHDTDWRWLEDRADSPWYPRKMRLFRQKTNGDWDSVVAELSAALRKWATATHQVAEKKTS
jgi:tetratricopeptide (TPR) repeat protein